MEGVGTWVGRALNLLISLAIVSTFIPVVMTGKLTIVTAKVAREKSELAYVLGYFLPSILEGTLETCLETSGRYLGCASVFRKPKF